MNPQPNLVNTVPNDIHDIINYFSTCEDPNPLLPGIVSIMTWLGSSTAKLQEVAGNCTNNDMSVIVEFLTTIATVLQTFVGSLDCNVLQKLLLDAFYYGTCEGIMNGAFIINICVYIIAVISLLLLIHLTYFRAELENSFNSNNSYEIKKVNVVQVISNNETSNNNA